HQTRVVTALHAGDLGTMLSEQREVVGIFDRVGDARNACLERSHLGLVYAELGEFPLAQSTLRLAIDTARSLQLHQTEAWSQNYLGSVLIHLGRSDDAAELLELSVQAAHRQ